MFVIGILRFLGPTATFKFCGWGRRLPKFACLSLIATGMAMSSLVIVESPAKCKKIQGFLGPGWNVIATMGHIRALDEDLDAVGLERDFEPRYAFLKEKSKAIAGLKSAAAAADTIYLASDDDREGEAIAFSVAVLLGLDPVTTPRSVFHEITKSAVCKAVEQPRRIDMNRVLAQQARSLLDMMIGFTISPLLWSYIGPALSAGRCQTPALRILVDREKELQNFQAQTVWRIRGQWFATVAGGTSPFVFTADLKDELEDQESALNYLENLHDDLGGTVLEAQTKPWSEGAPKPLITSTLQQEASALYKCAPKRTMQIAQKLYEGGHITYMRTDSHVLSEEAKKAATQFVQKHLGEQYVASAAAESSNKKKTAAPPGAQEAHEAIRPTHFTTVDLPSDEGWDTLDQKIYKLIWNRAVQSIMAAARGDERVLTFLADGDPSEFPWEVKWRRMTFPGWKKIGFGSVNLDETEATAGAETAAATWIQAISLREGDKIQWKGLEAYPHMSRPPGRYTEATLVRELEKRGIGRPSTYASLVSVLLDKKYAEKRDKEAKALALTHFHVHQKGQWPPKQEVETKNVGAERDKLVPTSLGLSCLDFCVREFAELFAYDFTAHMESRLDKIAEGQEHWKQVCRDTWASYKDHYEGLKKQGRRSAQTSSAKVREFGDGLKAVLGKKGPILLKEQDGDKDKTIFYGWPEGVSFGDLTEADARTFIDNKAKGTVSGTAWGQWEGQALQEKKGPFGRYIQCGTLSIPLREEDTPETVQQKLAAKKDAQLHSIGEFEFRKGAFGPFMYKKTTGGKKPTFVSLPSDLDPKTLTLEAAQRIYQNGIQQKRAGAASGGRGRGRGRGGGRGGRGGHTQQGQPR